MMLERVQGKFVHRFDPMLVARFVELRRRDPFTEGSRGQLNKRPVASR